MALLDLGIATVEQAWTFTSDPSSPVLKTITASLTAPVGKKIVSAGFVMNRRPPALSIKSFVVASDCATCSLEVMWDQMPSDSDLVITLRAVVASSGLLVL